MLSLDYVVIALYAAASPVVERLRAKSPMKRMRDRAEPAR
jgi:hypothetical protein